MLQCYINFTSSILFTTSSKLNLSSKRYQIHPVCKYRHAKCTNSKTLQSKQNWLNWFEWSCRESNIQWIFIVKPNTNLCEKILLDSSCTMANASVLACFISGLAQHLWRILLRHLWLQVCKIQYRVLTRSKP